VTERSRPLRRQILTVVGAAALVGWGSFVVAQPQVTPPAVAEPVGEPVGASPRLVLEARECAEREEAVRAAVAVEVGDLLLERSGTAVEARTEANDRLSLACAGSVVSIEAQAAFAKAALRRTIDLGAFPADAAARALALAGLETLAEVSPVVQRRLQERARAGASRASAAAPVVEPPVASPPGIPAPVAMTEPRTLVAFAAVGRGFAGSHGATLWGGDVSLERAVGQRWNGAVDLDASVGRRTTALGRIDIRAVSLGAFWELRARRSWFTGLVGVGGRAGLVNLSGRANDEALVAGESVVRPWAGPALRARVTVGRAMWVAIASAEAGVAARGAEGVANGDTAVALRGPWLAIGAGFGIRL